jgi:hypothetical protein
MGHAYALPIPRVMVIDPPLRCALNLLFQGMHLTWCGTVIMNIHISPHYEHLHGIRRHHALRWDILRFSSYLAMCDSTYRKTEGLRDEGKGVFKDEPTVWFLAWPNVIECDGAQLLKVLLGNGKAEKLTITTWSARRPCENDLRSA